MLLRSPGRTCLSASTSAFASPLSTSTFSALVAFFKEDAKTLPLTTPSAVALAFCLATFEGLADRPLTGESRGHSTCISTRPLRTLSDGDPTCAAACLLRIMRRTISFWSSAPAMLSSSRCAVARLQ